VVKTAQKEKVVRVGLLSLRNLLADGDAIMASDMVDAGLAKVVASRSMQVGGGCSAVQVVDTCSRSATQQKVPAGRSPAQPGSATLRLHSLWLGQGMVSETVLKYDAC